MKPLPWSHTALDDFVNCPRSYYEKRVAKSVKEARSEQMIWGEWVHKQFEDRLGLNVPLPADLWIHEPFMQKLDDKPGLNMTEVKFAFDQKAKPCHFFDQHVWFRGVLDFHKVHEDIGLLVDYKTGKPHTKFKQLALFAIYMFHMYPNIRMVNAQYYWTQTQTVSLKAWGREEIPALWGLFIPELKQYAQAFREEVWQPRPSGLCNGWCPVKTCEFWKPRKER